MALFRKGTRLLTVASVILLLEAVAHTMGAVAPLPEDPAVQDLVRAMRDLHTPLGLGMEPSAWDISRGLTFTMTVTLLLMGVLGLAIPSAARGDGRVVRVTAGTLLGANLAMLAIWCIYRVPPPLTFQAILTPILLLATFGGRASPDAAPTAAGRQRPARQGAALVACAAGALLGSARAAEAQVTSEPRAREPIVGLPCEGCEGVFDRLPASLSSVARIAPADEPGEPMRIEGTVYDADGHPAPGIIVYAYHTNAHGVYPEDERAEGTAGRRHGRLRGWARTDEQGRYRFDSIRPASYPDGRTPAHVHMHVIEPGRCTYYIDSIHFADDPRLSPEERAGDPDARGGNGVVRPEHDDRGIWVVRRDITLGEGVPDYAACGERP